MGRSNIFIYLPEESLACIVSIFLPLSQTSVCTLSFYFSYFLCFFLVTELTSIQFCNLSSYLSNFLSFYWLNRLEENFQKWGKPLLFDLAHTSCEFFLHLSFNIVFSFILFLWRVVVLENNPPHSLFCQLARSTIQLNF